MDMRSGNIFETMVLRRSSWESMPFRYMKGRQPRTWIRELLDTTKLGLIVTEIPAWPPLRVATALPEIEQLAAHCA